MLLVAAPVIIASLVKVVVEPRWGNEAASYCHKWPHLLSWKMENRHKKAESGLNKWNAT